jgi:hypothetical protein
MLIATSLAAMTLLAAAGPAPIPNMPSIVVDVAVATDMSPRLVTRILEETGAIWRFAGIALAWERVGPLVTSASAREPLAGAVAALSPGPLARLRVIVGDEQRTAGNDPTVKALGWIRFEADAPEQEIYVSYKTAVELFNESETAVGRIAGMTVVEREELLARAMGRALAHEIGHYLLGSKAHTTKGLMQARLTAAQLFANTWRSLYLMPHQKLLIAARLNANPPVALAGASASR